MAKRRTPAPGISDTVREAVERTVQATVGQAQETRGRAQRSVDDLVRGAEEGAKTVRETVRGAIEDRRPVTYEELKDLQKQIRTIARRLDEIEKRLPAKRSTAAKRGTTAKRSTRTTSSRAKKTS
jgi:polyhydroxyalkanoate synthesis regulator phasin